MKIIVVRDGIDYGPYEAAAAAKYLVDGALYRNDLARDAADSSKNLVPLPRLLRTAGAYPKSAGTISTAWQNLKYFDFSLLLPLAAIRDMSWTKDRRLVALAAVGLSPIVAIVIAPGAWFGYWLIAFYFSGLWAIFFYYLFKTPQVTAKTSAITFFTTGIVAISVLLLLQLFPPWSTFYAMTESESGLVSFVGYFFGVGINEELCKAAVLFYLASRPGKLLIPQTLVYYGMISGLGFGIYEGVHYQMGVNRELVIDDAYFLNIARLTSLPFLHATWTGIAGYFIGFASLSFSKRYGLWVLAILIPAFFHAVYDTFGLGILGWGFFGLVSAVLSVLLMNLYLTNTIKMQKNLRGP